MLKCHLCIRPEGQLVTIHIPLVHRFPYLGLVASLGNFEMQTCRHRLRACAQVRHRILGALHSSELQLKQQVVLYQACVRSSMLYGQHARGVTMGVLRKLEAQDAKSLRGTARSPAHLWNERSTALRALLKIHSVHKVLRQA